MDNECFEMVAMTVMQKGKLTMEETALVEVRSILMKVVII
jgi:hypothetical protein